MPKNKVDFDIVHKVATALPSVEAGTAYGGRAWKLKGKILTCQAVHRSAEPNSLVVQIGPEERAKLLARDPSIYYVTDHYLPHASILVRLDNIDRKSLESLLKIAWQYVSA
jgi:hypothetical protein